ncbi:hypothetical protein F3Y22_tig00112215pilonHSYRG00137 [Hibiscus syriacus]|uniref:Uncharacterized protein n=1 Tax=Hibiscus syriacus TaxID=106335 RepID=A0A6A2Y8D0_HIBSY|nr:hypothetical protein F3Y22_tig00112215pilonHSYRG00137 [Hibiscus syriacus]
MSSYMGYTRVPKRSKGLRLNIQCRRFSVQGLRACFLYFFNQITRFRSYFRSVFRKMRMNGSCRSGWRCRRTLVSPNVIPLADTYRLRSSLGRSNSLYSEAISDCLEFIKRCSVSDNDPKKPLQVNYVTPTLHSS